MNAELKRRKRWFRALQIAEIMFEYEGYHTAYLTDLKNYVKEEEMYSPKISEDLIPKLYRKARLEGLPMTEVVDRILRAVLDGQGLKGRRKG